VARLNLDGSLDPGFNPTVTNFVSSLALQPDGKILVGGYFSSVGGTGRYHLARLNPDGTLGAEPALIRAPASLSGPPLVESAKWALRQCQPYDFLPADQYQDWRILELSFSVYGPSDDLGGPARNNVSPR
jgi:hypothetical protein